MEKQEFLNRVTGNESKVLVKVVSSRGHDEHEVTPEAALRIIREEASQRNKWVYIDTKRVDPDAISLEDLIEADDITLTNALVGGTR